MPHRIVLVGHCGVDGPRLQQEIQGFLQPVEVLRVNDTGKLTSVCKEGADLLLVNREPLGFDPKDGVDLIRDVCRDHPGQKAMLVSDYPDAQEQARAAGALPGFGKGDIGSSKFPDAVKAALAE